MTRGRRIGRAWGEPLLHPACLLSMAVWWLNDHVGKVYAPSALTGKASDVACLVVFPVWSWCLVDGAAGWISPRTYRQSRQLRLLCLYAVTAGICIWFALINVSDVVGAIHRDLWTSVYGVLHGGLAHIGGYWPPAAHHTVDAEDLWTLPSAVVGIWVGHTWLTNERCGSSPHGRRVVPVIAVRPHDFPTIGGTIGEPERSIGLEPHAFAPRRLSSARRDRR